MFCKTVKTALLFNRRTADTMSEVADYVIEEMDCVYETAQWRTVK